MTYVKAAQFTARTNKMQQWLISTRKSFSLKGAQHLFCDNLLLDFASALINPSSPDLSVEFLDDLAAADAVATMQLQGLVYNFLCYFGRVKLCH